jgi:hypothetical protein
MIGWSVENQKIDLCRWVANFVGKCKDWSNISMVKCLNEWAIDEEVKSKRRHTDAWRDLEKWITAVGFWSVDSCRWG